MRAAPVGDDEYGEVPIATRLGTMANLAAVMTHAQPGDEAIVEDQGHIYRVEGSMVAIAGVIPRLVPGERGVITAARLEAALAHSRPGPGLLCLENTHNLAGGTVITPQQTGEVCAVAHGRGMRVHLDGARIFNAAIALGVDVQALGGDAASVMFGVSRGLSAPVAWLLSGGANFIPRARRTRKYLGGG